jgi:hypothetical protein
MGRLNEVAADQALYALADGQVGGEQTGKDLARGEGLVDIQDSALLLHSSNKPLYY